MSMVDLNVSDVITDYFDMSDSSDDVDGDGEVGKRRFCLH